MPSFNDDDYLDVLQNIEFAILRACSDPESAITDYEVMRAVDALLDDYRGLARGREPRPHGLDAPEQAIFDAAKAMCDWRMGKAPFPLPVDAEAGETADADEPDPVSIEVMTGCLKKIRKSIDRWNNAGGPQGYLDFIGNFVG